MLVAATASVFWLQYIPNIPPTGPVLATSAPPCTPTASAFQSISTTHYCTPVACCPATCCYSNHVFWCQCSSTTAVTNPLAPKPTCPVPAVDVRAPAASAVQSISTTHYCTHVACCPATCSYSNHVFWCQCSIATAVTNPLAPKPTCPVPAVDVRAPAASAVQSITTAHHCTLLHTTGHYCTPVACCPA
jgi:hypothetical protein